MEFKIGDRVAGYFHGGRRVGEVAAITARYEQGRKEYYLEVAITDNGDACYELTFHSKACRLLVKKKKEQAQPEAELAMVYSNNVRHKLLIPKKEQALLYRFIERLEHGLRALEDCHEMTKPRRPEDNIVRHIMPIVMNNLRILICKISREMKEEIKNG
jgi:hypothetical protein